MINKIRDGGRKVTRYQEFVEMEKRRKKKNAKKFTNVYIKHSKEDMADEKLKQVVLKLGKVTSERRGRI